MTEFAHHTEAFREWFGMEPAPASMIALMFELNAELVSYDLAEERLGMKRPHVRCAMSDVRNAMDFGSYVSNYGVGYRLTQQGLRECRAALADAEHRRVAA